MTQWTPSNGSGPSSHSIEATGRAGKPKPTTLSASGLSVLAAGDSRSESTKEGTTPRLEDGAERAPLGTNVDGSVSAGTCIAGFLPGDHDCLRDQLACAHGSDERIAESLPAHRLLRACAVEARRLLAEASTLDASVAEALTNAARSGADPSHMSLLTASLQGLDLLCQEIDGLGRILVLLADKANCDGMVSGDKFTAAVKLGAQRRRLLVEGPLATDR